MVDFDTKDKDVYKGEIGLNFTYHCIVKWPSIAQHRAIEDINKNQKVIDAMVKFKYELEDWLEENCGSPYKIPEEMTLNGIHVSFTTKQDWAFCCANHNIVTKLDSFQGKLAVQNGQIIAY
tara:strand:- start:1783 stop:2145 length:363 start_codon:yes stop_codon:yes gene_type:complete